MTAKSPNVECRTCGFAIPLSQAVRSEFVSPASTLPWRANFACPNCGHVHEYHGPDLSKLTKTQPGAPLVPITAAVRCSRSTCDAKAIVHGFVADKAKLRDLLPWQGQIV